MITFRKLLRMIYGAKEATLPYSGHSLKHSGLEHYLVTWCFENDIETSGQLYSEICNPSSHFQAQLHAIDVNRLFTAFFSLN